MTLLTLGNADASIAFLSLNRKVKFRLFANNGCYPFDRLRVNSSGSIGPYPIGLSGQAHLAHTQARKVSLSNHLRPGAYDDEQL